MHVSAMIQTSIHGCVLTVDIVESEYEISIIYEKEEYKCLSTLKGLNVSYACLSRYFADYSEYIEMFVYRGIIKLMLPIPYQEDVEILFLYNSAVMFDELQQKDATIADLQNQIKKLSGSKFYTSLQELCEFLEKKLENICLKVSLTSIKDDTAPSSDTAMCSGLSITAHMMGELIDYNIDTLKQAIERAFGNRCHFTNKAYFINMQPLPLHSAYEDIKKLMLSNDSVKFDSGGHSYLGYFYSIKTGTNGVYYYNVCKNRLKYIDVYISRKKSTATDFLF